MRFHFLGGIVFRLSGLLKVLNQNLKPNKMKSNLLRSAIVAVLIAISTNAHAFTAVVSGAWSSATTWGGVGPGTTVSSQDVIIPTGITVDLDVDVTFSGLVINTFTVDGTLNSTANHNIWMTGGAFAGSGTVDVHRLSFSGLLTTASFTGSLTVNTLQNQGSALALAAFVTISDTLDLDGGSILINTGGNVSLMTDANVRVDAGTLATGGGVFTTTTSYDVWYYGTSKTSGLEVNSTNLGDLHLMLDDNLQILTQGINNLVINGALDMQTGQLDISNNHITLKGDIVVSTGSLLISSATTDITVMGSGPTADGLRFTATSSVHDIEIDRSPNGSCKLGTSVACAGTIFLTDGDFILMSGATLTMNAGSKVQVTDGDFVQNGGVFDGTASYDVNFVGGSHTSGVELTGSGLNNVMLGMSSMSDTVMLDDDVTINGNLDMSTGMMSLEGYDLSLEGTFDQNASAVFIGDSASSMTINVTTANGDTLYFGGQKYLDDFELDIPAAGMLLLASDLTIYGALDLTSGKLEITNSNLHMRSTASVNGYDDTRYIVTAGSGQVEMQVNSNSTYVTYPIGTLTNYAPAAIQQTSTGTSGMFQVRAMDNVYSQGTTGFDASSTESVVDKTWVVNSAAAVVVNMNIRLGWKQADEVNGFNRNQSRISKYGSNVWDTYPASAATPGANNTYESTRQGVTSTGPFAVVDTSAILGVEKPAIAAGINIYPNPTADVVTVETGDAHAAYLYEVYDVTGKIVTSTSNANAVNKFDFTSYTNGCYFIKITNTDSNATVIKRIVKN
jgi:hypothetical protein